MPKSAQINQKVSKKAKKMAKWQKKPKTYRIMFSYSLSLPLESFHRRNITEASTLAGL
jgi:hypothetical protein